MVYKQVSNNVYTLNKFDDTIIEDIDKAINTLYPELNDNDTNVSPIVINKIFEELLVTKLSILLSKEDFVNTNVTYYFTIKYKQLNIRFNFRVVEEDNKRTIISGPTMSVINTYT